MANPEINVGVVGTHVGPSYSPVIHAYLAKAKGISPEEYNFGRFPIDDIEDINDDLERVTRMARFLKEQMEAGTRGVAVTMPFKVDVLETGLVTVEDPKALAIGAVNTLVSRDDQWFGHNTDWIGAVNCIKNNGIDIKDKQVLIIGAGGTAKAVAEGMASEGPAQIAVANRTVSRAESLLENLGNHWPGLFTRALELDTRLGSPLERALVEADIVFNATNVGQAGGKFEGQNPIGRCLPGDGVFVDAVYDPLVTPFLRSKRDRYDEVVLGTHMLAAQALPQFGLIAGVHIGEAEQMEHFNGALGAINQERLSRGAGSNWN